MLEFIKLIIGTAFLILGFPIGLLISRWTKEELNAGQKYFKILIWIGLIGGLIGLIIGSDILLFTMFFIAIVTSGSVKYRKNKLQKKKHGKN